MQVGCREGKTRWEARKDSESETEKNKYREKMCDMGNCYSYESFQPFKMRNAESSDTFDIISNGNKIYRLVMRSLPAVQRAITRVKPHPKAHSCSNKYPRSATLTKYMASHLVSFSTK